MTRCRICRGSRLQVGAGGAGSEEEIGLVRSNLPLKCYIALHPLYFLIILLGVSFKIFGLTHIIFIPACAFTVQCEFQREK